MKRFIMPLLALACVLACLTLAVAPVAAQCPGGVCRVPAAAVGVPVAAVVAPHPIYSGVPYAGGVVYHQQPPVIRLQSPATNVQAVYYYRPTPDGPFIQYWPPPGSLQR